MVVTIVRLEGYAALGLLSDVCHGILHLDDPVHVSLCQVLEGDDALWPWLAQVLGWQTHGSFVV